MHIKIILVTWNRDGTVDPKHETDGPAGRKCGTTSRSLKLRNHADIEFFTASALFNHCLNTVLYCSYDGPA